MKNASEYWSDAMAEFDFEFFRNLYEDLQSPVLDNENSDCQFLSWDSNFRSVQVSRILKKGFFFQKMCYFFLGNSISIF